MFRIIYKIAKAEVALLFYSPVAWLLLVVFAIQSASIFSGMMFHLADRLSVGQSPSNMTSTIFGANGLFGQMQGYLYFYIPLLTMGLLSRELSSGSIKLLYSSPITNFQIVIGKYLSVMLYGLALLAVLFVMILVSWFTVKDFGLAEAMTGLLGIYLLLCAYGAVGVFMSSLTSYQIVAAIGTLIILMLFAMVGGWGQEYNFIRDVTYWLSINGRSTTFIEGMICTEDVLYFLIVISLFLALTIIRLNAVRQKIPFSITLCKNLGVIVLTCLLGYFTSLPTLKWYYDTTATKRNTLTEHSQEIVAKMKGDLTISTYINGLDDPFPARGLFIKVDEMRFEQYVRFKPKIKLKNVYYYDEVPARNLAFELVMRREYAKLKNAGVKNIEGVLMGLKDKYSQMPLERQLGIVCEQFRVDSNKFISPEDIKKQIDLSEEGNVFVRQLVRESGEKTWLRVYNDRMRYPDEREITAAFKRLVMELPVVGFVTGHNERSSTGLRDIDYKSFATQKDFRQALLNQGFDTKVFTLDRPVPENVNIIVIADPRCMFNEAENRHLDAYIQRGGNLVIMGEPRRREVMNSLLDRFGIEMVPGTLIQPDSMRQAADILASYPMPALKDICYEFEGMLRRKIGLASTSVAGLRQVDDKGFTVKELFKSAPNGSWNEMETIDFMNDTAKLNPDVGEVEQSYPTVLALSRRVGDREQKIIVSGDADCISNVGMDGHRGVRSSNFTLITGGFYWLSDGEVPIDVRRPAGMDNKLFVGKTGVASLKWSFMLILPLLLTGGGVFTWLRRRSR